MGKSPAARYYALYDPKTDRMVCCGSSKFCADQLGIEYQKFRQLISSIRRNRSHRYALYEEDMPNDEWLRNETRLRAG